MWAAKSNLGRPRKPGGNNRRLQQSWSSHGQSRPQEAPGGVLGGSGMLGGDLRGTYGGPKEDLKRTKGGPQGDVRGT